MAETELKPACNCPFCGAFPEYNDQYAWCWGPPEDRHGLVQLQISRWNRRTPDLRAGMEKAAEIAEKMQREVDELEETYAREKLPAIVLDPNGDQIAAAIRQAAEEA